MISFPLIAAFLAVVKAGDVPSLTPDNYNDLTDGKTVFIKFFAPWCAHCKKMAPDWERLSDEWAGSEFGLVAEVDCTGEGKPLCDDNGVRGFPTLKYGDPANLDDYQGSRSYVDLTQFAKENLKPICSVYNLNLCDNEQKAQIEMYMNMSDEDLNSAMYMEEKKVEEAEKAYKDAIAILQAEYQKISEEKDATIAAIKDSGLGLMRSVVNAKQKKSKDEL